MLTSKNLLAGLGAFAGLGVALMPLSNVSATEPVTTDDVATGAESDAHEVRARVGETLSIEVTDEVYDDTDNNMITLGAGSVADNFLTHTIEVKGNTKNDYTLTIAAGTNGNAMKHTEQNSVTIPAGTTLNETTSAWGYKYANTAAGLDSVSAWSAVPASGTPDLHTASGTKTASYTEQHYVRYGVSAAADQLSGIYTAEVVYKASAVSAL